MGQSTSKYNSENTDHAKVDNIKKLFNINEQNENLDSLNLDMNFTNNKIPLPLIHQGGDLSANNETVQNRFTKHDIFNLITSIEESLNQQGGQSVPTTQVVDNNTSDASMLHIKEAVLRELNGQAGAGPLGESESGCGCDKAKCDNQAGGKKKKSKKSRKVIKNTSDAGMNSSSSNDNSDPSDTDNNSSSMGDDNNNNNNNNNKKNNNKEGNFSIYPYNSSDVSSNASERNFRMLRRKI